MTEPTVSFAGNLTEDPGVRYTESGIARAMFRVAVSGRTEQEASFFTVIVWRHQAQHAAESLAKGSRVVVVGWRQQRTWTAEDGRTRSVVEVVAEELGPSLRWATAQSEPTTRSTTMTPQRRSGAGHSGSRLRRVGTTDGGWSPPGQRGLLRWSATPPDHRLTKVRIRTSPNPPPLRI